jgi:hypothetical protein
LGSFAERGNSRGLCETMGKADESYVFSVPRPFRLSASGRNKFHPSIQIAPLSGQWFRGALREALGLAELLDDVTAVGDDGILDPAAVSVIGCRGPPAQVLATHCCILSSDAESLNVIYGAGLESLGPRVSSVWAYHEGRHGYWLFASWFCGCCVVSVVV